MEQHTTRRRFGEIAFWAVLITVLWSLDLATKFLDHANSGTGPGKPLLIAEQVTSAAAAFVMVAFVTIWVRQFPLVRGQALRSTLGHLVGSIAFTVGHYLLLVLMRIAIYPLYLDREYVWWGKIGANLVYEYQKDIKIYVVMVMLISAYRYWRAQESARTGPAAKRLIVQTGSGEHLIGFEKIECLTAARNYISVFTSEREYVVRETMTNIEKRLPKDQFIRSHRSHIVNLERISEIRNTESGGQVIKLRAGREVPVGRSYRDHVRERMTSTSV